MKKKICIIILSIVIVCSLLSGCGDKHTAIIMKNAKDFKKLTDLKQEKVKLEQSLENKIQSRERILNSFNQKKQAKNK